MPPPPYSSKGFRRFRLGFTLAETLITLTIIGIIAALTVPTLMRNYKAAHLKSAFFKASSIITNLSQTITNDGINNLSELTVDEIAKYFNGSNVKTNTISEARAANIYTIFSSNSIYMKSAGLIFLQGEFTLKNGMTGLIFNGGSYNYPDPARDIIMAIDINGKRQAPNRLGHDTFFWYYNDKTKYFEPCGSINLKGELIRDFEICSINNYRAENGMGCTAKALTDKDWFQNLPK